MGLNSIEIQGRFLEELHEGKVSKLWRFKTNDNTNLVASTFKSLKVDKNTEYKAIVRLEAVPKELGDKRKFYKNVAYVDHIEEVNVESEVD